MNATFPQDEGTESAEGTAAHWVAWEILAGRTPHEGSLTPNNQAVTGEMLDGGKLMAETVQGTFALPMGDREFHIETKLAASHIHEDCFGTPDVWGWFQNIDHSFLDIDLLDYKFGHRFVDERSNLQGISYFVAILEALKINDWCGADRIRCNFTIVQPRCYYRGEPVRTHSYTLQEALVYIAVLQVAARRAYEPQPEALTNSNCIDCPGRHACDALQLGAYEAAEFSTRNIPVQLDPKAAALELRMLERKLDHLSARVDGLREVTLRNIQVGAPVPYFHLEYGRGSKVWDKPDEQILNLGKVFGHELTKPKLLTPTQAIDAGVSATVVNAMSKIQHGKAKLVPDDVTDVARVFNK